MIREGALHRPAPEEGSWLGLSGTGTGTHTGTNAGAVV